MQRKYTIFIICILGSLCSLNAMADDADPATIDTTISSDATDSTSSYNSRDADGATNTRNPEDSPNSRDTTDSTSTTESTDSDLSNTSSSSNSETQPSNSSDATTSGTSSNLSSGSNNNSPTSNTQDETYTIQITSPKQEQTFQNDEEITIGVAIAPKLNEKNTVVFLVDGSPVGEPVHATSMTLPLLERGEHTVQARVMGEDGELAASDIITIYQQRHSILLGPSPGPVTETNRMGVRQIPQNTRP